MGIIQLPTPLPSQVGLAPATKKMVTTDSLATITTAGYLNSVNLESFPLSPTDILEIIYSYVQNTNSGIFGLFTVAISNGVITLTQADLTGGVTLPTIVNHLIVSTNTTGQLANLTGTAINNGSIQAGLATGTAGTFISYAASSGKGSLILSAVANTGNTNTTISNVAMGQASVISIPDPANALGRFLIAATATPFTSGNIPAASGTGGLMVDSGKSAAALPTFTSPTIANHIAVFTNTSGNLGEDAATAINGGNIQAGLSGTAGTLASFPATASNGSLIVAAINNSGGFNTTISNSNIGQSSVVSIPDPGAATAKFILDSGTQAMAAASQLNFAKVSAAESANAVTASGQAGFITTSALTTAAGATYSITWTNTHITSTSVIHLSIQGGTNTVQSVQFTCAPGSGTAALVINNIGPTNALNGTIIIGYLVC